MKRTSTIAAALVLAACGGERSVRTDAVLSDGRNDGAAGFHFLPPVAANPGEGTNLRGLGPVVEIRSLPDETLFAAFSGDAVKESGDHYMVHWSTKEHVPAAGTTYRISVLLDGATLGFADAAVARNGRELRMLASEEVFGLTGRRTVPVKFRISEVAGDGDEDDDGVPDEADVCLTVPDPDQGDVDEDGIGDACECLDVVCEEPAEACRVAACDPTGACVTSVAPDESGCRLPEGVPGLCVEGECTQVLGSVPVAGG